MLVNEVNRIGHVNRIEYRRRMPVNEVNRIGCEPA